MLINKQHQERNTTLAWDAALEISARLSGIAALMIAVTTLTLMYAVTGAALGVSWIAGKSTNRGRKDG